MWSWIFTTRWNACESGGGNAKKKWTETQRKAWIKEAEKQVVSSGAVAKAIEDMEQTERKKSKTGTAYFVLRKEQMQYSAFKKPPDGQSKQRSSGKRHETHREFASQRDCRECSGCGKPTPGTDAVALAAVMQRSQAVAPPPSLGPPFHPFAHTLKHKNGAVTPWRERVGCLAELPAVITDYIRRLSLRWVRGLSFASLVSAIWRRVSGDEE